MATAIGDGNGDAGHFGDVDKVWVANQIKAEEMFEAENEEASDFVDASMSLPVKLGASCVAVLVPPIVEVLKAEEQPLHSTKEETSDVFLDANSSIPIDLEAKNDDAPFITEGMTKEEEQLYEDRLKLEEEEARKRKQAARLAFDPNANSSVPIDLESKNDDASFMTEVMAKEEEQLYETRLKIEEEEARKREQAARLAFDANANSSVPIDLEAKNDDTSFITEVMTKEEEQLYEAQLKVEEEEARKSEQAARLAFDPNANSSVPIDLEAKNDDTSFITEVMMKEEEQLYVARLKVEEEEARKREQAARVAFDPNANSSVPIDLEAKNGDASFVTEVMTNEEEQLYEGRLKVEEEEARQREQAARVACDPNACFSKLDELLTETQLYSEFLLEKMEQITDNFVEVKDEEESVEDKKKGCGRKRKVNSKPQYNDKKAKTAVAAMLTRSREDRSAYDDTLTEEERWEKEQANLVPLMTGGQLKSYQIKGVKWLISLWQNGLNGILADQMGLGKTIQTIGFLTHLKGNGMHGPYMIIAPLSTLSNWVNEISRFVPSLTGLIYHGDKVARAEIRRKFRPKTVGPDFPIIITSYEMAMSDAKFLARYKWKYVVVDEGHRLKNSKCKLLRKLKRIPMANKLLLTGTPLQNNLAELWSLLNFILPDIFSSHQEFESWFDFSGKGDEEQQEEADEKKRVLVVSKLHAILRPFLLRRMKVDVEQMLPRKKEIIIYANMTAHQKQIQTHLIEKTFDNYLFESTDIVLRRPGMKMKLNNLMIQLRKNCAHPDLFNAAFDSTSLYPPTDKLLEQCGKFQLFDRLLESLLKQKHKVLIFSQWTKVLDIIEYYLYMKGLNICRIDGSVKLEDRMRQIAEFNDLNSSMNVFILSTRAGGLGINLASADTCILYDSDWNPQMDLQAMDRCHRIGQTRPVHVYRLATSNSVEGRIIKRAFGKLKLEHVVIGKGQFEQNSAKPNVLDEEELLALLRDEQDEEDRMIQTDISDEDLLKVMDRSDLTGPPAAADAPPLIPLKGPGWEVVMASKSGGGVLSALTS